MVARDLACMATTQTGLEYSSKRLRTLIRLVQIFDHADMSFERRLIIFQSLCNPWDKGIRHAVNAPQSMRIESGGILVTVKLESFQIALSFGRSQ